ncbi:hypothetical protein CDV36_015424 [Fusarium kuroshium]|uniref:Uncharacterized protein n=1 Tax=Fusarium kuroshium TaxID=2010991 RepID=A0A3M2RAJ0_9HYPO|nr:hypothetical protein CDV36_015424 [Fusarium kuroshium]
MSKFSQQASCLRGWWAGLIRPHPSPATGVQKSRKKAQNQPGQGTSKFSRARRDKAAAAAKAASSSSTTPNSVAAASAAAPAPEPKLTAAAMAGALAPEATAKAASSLLLRRPVSAVPCFSGPTASPIPKREQTTRPSFPPKSICDGSVQNATSWPPLPGS